jgi:hypothetical protein
MSISTKHLLKQSSIAELRLKKSAKINSLKIKKRKRSKRRRKPRCLPSSFSKKSAKTSQKITLIPSKRHLSSTRLAK